MRQTILRWCAYLGFACMAIAAPSAPLAGQKECAALPQAGVKADAMTTVCN